MSYPRHAIARLLSGSLLATLCGAACAGPTAPQLQAACRPDDGAGSALGQIQVRAVQAVPGDLPYYEARSSETGNSVRLYHESDLADAAAAEAPCLMGMLDLLSTGLAHLRGPVAWSPLVLTHDAHYIPPRRDGELRWVTAFDGTTWKPANLRFLLVVMPHEETHLSQDIGGKHLPRWFLEGHAEWVGLQVTEQASPELAAGERDKLGAAFRKLGAANLGAWGGLRVKPEAIERQLSAEDRERRRKDPSYSPPGPFSFGPGDFVEDNADETDRYGAALAVFSGLEQRHGRPAVQAWVSVVLASKDPKQIVPLASRMLREDLAPLLQ